MVDSFDHNAAASGMRYSNDRNRGGVVVDRQPDILTRGRQNGSSSRARRARSSRTHWTDTNISNLPVTNHYLDDSTPSEAQCSGDAASHGASGPWINGTIADTDPRSCTTDVLRARRSLTYLPPGTTAGEADLAWQRSVYGLAVTAGNRS